MVVLLVLAAMGSLAMAVVAAEVSQAPGQVLTGHLLVFSALLAVSAVAIVATSCWKMRRMLHHELFSGQARFARVLESARIGIWVRELRTGVEHWSQEAFRLFGLDAGTFPPDLMPAIRLRVHLLDRSRVSDWLQALEAGNVDESDISFRVVLPEGELRALRARAIVEREADRKPVRIDAIVQDISAQVNSECRLRRREEEFRALSENLPDVIIRFDRRLRCIYANAAAVRVMNLNPQEVLGRSIMEMNLPGAIAAQWNKSLGYVLQMRQTDIFEFSLSSDAGTRHYQVRVVPELTVRGMVGRVLAVARDVSAIKKSELMLRRLSARAERVREEERKKIAREVHDELGQTLTGLRMDISLLQRELGDASPDVTERLQSMKDAALRAIRITRNVTSALRPAALDLGLPAALEWLLDDFRRRSSIDYELHVSSGEIHLPEEVASALFRIAQESLTNVVKHANATAVEVSLDLRDDEVVLEVTDNGKGFAVSDPPKASSFGLMGIRERALMLNGDADIRSRVNWGTVVRVRLPVSHPEHQCADMET